mgnify:CR=1 FL=1
MPRLIIQDFITLNIMRPDGISDEEERRLDAAITEAVPEVREFYRRWLAERGYENITVEWADEGKSALVPEPDESDPEDN